MAEPSAPCMAARFDRQVLHQTDPLSLATPTAQTPARASNSAPKARAALVDDDGTAAIASAAVSHTPAHTECRRSAAREQRQSKGPSSESQQQLGTRAGIGEFKVFDLLLRLHRKNEQPRGWLVGLFLCEDLLLQHSQQR